MAITTHFWTTWTGKRIPVELLTDNSLKAAHKLCFFTKAFYERPDYRGKPLDVVALSARDMGFVRSLEEVTKFLPILEAEIKRRKKNWKALDKYDLTRYMKIKQETSRYLKNSFKNLFNA